MRLEQYVEQYLLAREVSREYAQALRSIVKEFSRWRKKPATTADLFDDQINRWLSDLCQANGRARITLANKRTMLLVLWRAAWMDGHTKQPPKRIRKINAPTPSPLCWDKRQLAALLAVASKLDGRFKRSRVPRAQFWKAFILCGFYTGLRLGDLCRLRWEQIGPDGTLVVIQHKTGQEIICRVRRNGLIAMRKIRSEKRPRVFGDCLSRCRTMRQFGALARSAGLAGGTKMLRRSGATMVEIAAPGWAKEHLGHRTAGVAERFYLDRSKIQRRKPIPPPIR